MRAFVHLLLFACGIAIAVGSFLSVLGDVALRNVALADLRDGFPSTLDLDVLAGQSVGFASSAAVVVLGSGLLVLLSGLTGLRLLGWLGVLAGLGTLGVTAWRLHAVLGAELTDNATDLVVGPVGAALVGGGLLLSLLGLLVPRERTARRPAGPGAF